MKNLILPIVALAVLLIAAASIVRTQPVTVKGEPQFPPPRTSFGERVAAVGIVESSSENVSLAAHLSGVVDKVWVKAGQTIKSGDALVTLDTRALQSQLDERRAELLVRQAAVSTAAARVKTAQAGFNEAQRTLKIAESLSDPRSISADELTRRRSAVEVSEATAQAAEAEVSGAKAAVVAAQAAVATVETELARSTVRSPLNGQVLQVRIRPGEFALSGVAAQPWMVLGTVDPLHVRVDIDEHEAWRVSPTKPAIGQVRGNSSLNTPLTFVRFEPLVIPKVSLTGSSAERVDTRVLQAIYRIERKDLPLFVGQQMDVFIEAEKVAAAQLTH